MTASTARPAACRCVCDTLGAFNSVAPAALAAAPPLLDALHEGAGGLGLGVTAATRTPAVDHAESGGMSRRDRVGAGLLLGAHPLPAHRTEPDRRGAQHDHEPDDPDLPQAADRAAHQDRDADREDEPGEQCAAASRLAKRRTTEGRGEFRVLFDERALHLLEQSQLLFGEWHRFPPRMRSTTGVEGL